MVPWPGAHGGLGGAGGGRAAVLEQAAAALRVAAQQGVGNGGFARSGGANDHHAGVGVVLGTGGQEGR